MNEFERKLLDSPSLPTLPAVAQQLLELLNQSEPELSELADVISRDPGLSAKVIKMINSPLYAVSREITTLRDAVMYLGLKTVQSVALSFSIISSMRRSRGGATAQLDDLWRVSLMTALGARRLAAETGSWDPEEAFLAGLLEKAGALVLFQQAPAYDEIVERFLAGERELVDLEREELDTDHARVGALVLEKWAFPESMLAALRAHFVVDQPEAGEDAAMRGRILSGAAMYARTLAVEGFACEAGSLERRVAQLMEIPATLAGSIAAELPGELRRAAEMFAIPTESQRSYEDLLALANEALSTLSIEAEASANAVATKLANSSRGFEDLMDTEPEDLARDGDTGTFDPASFDRILQAFHSRARQLHRPLGLLVVSLEDHKSLSTQKGDQVARTAIVRVAERVEKLVRRTDPRGRLADAQLCVLAPGCSRGDLHHVAQRLREGIESQPLETEAGPIRCQIAIGMAASTPHHDGIDARSLLTFACSALDKAVHAGEPIAMGG